MIETTEVLLENGDRVYIKVRFNDLYKKLVVENVGVKHKGKRSIIYIDNSTDYTFRALKTYEERIEYNMKRWLEFLTIEQINSALLNTWESLKPIV